MRRSEEDRVDLRARWGDASTENEPERGRVVAIVGVRLPALRPEGLRRACAEDGGDGWEFILWCRAGEETNLRVEGAVVEELERGRRSGLPATWIRGVTERETEGDSGSSGMGVGIGRSSMYSSLQGRWRELCAEDEMRDEVTLSARLATSLSL